MLSSERRRFSYPVFMSKIVSFLRKWFPSSVPPATHLPSHLSQFAKKSFDLERTKSSRSLIHSVGRTDAKEHKVEIGSDKMSVGTYQMVCGEENICGHKHSCPKAYMRILPSPRSVGVIYFYFTFHHEVTRPSYFPFKSVITLSLLMFKHSEHSESFPDLWSLFSPWWLGLLKDRILKGKRLSFRLTP